MTSINAYRRAHRVITKHKAFSTDAVVKLRGSLNKTVKVKSRYTRSTLIQKYVIQKVRISKESFFIRIDQIESVSYTHLDVYKRQ